MYVYTPDMDLDVSALTLAVSRIKLARPDALTAKAVHAALIEETEWSEVTLSGVALVDAASVRRGVHRRHGSFRHLDI